MDVDAGTVDSRSLGHGRDSLAALRNRLHKLSQDHASLSLMREDLLMERARLSASVTGVRNRRISTANAEKRFINSLREFYRVQGDGLPQTIAEAYDKVREERDALEVVEFEHVIAERTLDSVEWSFMLKERDLYRYSLQETLTELEFTSLRSVRPAVNQDPPPLPPSPSPPSPPPPPPHFVPMNEVVLRNPPPPPPPASFLQDIIIIRNPPPPPPPPPPANLLPNIIRNLPPPPLPSLPPSSHPPPLSHGCSPDDSPQSLASATVYREICDEPLTKLAEVGVKFQRLEQDGKQCGANSIFRQRRTSEPVKTDRRHPTLVKASIRAQTDEVLTSSDVDPDYKLSIRDWLLDYVGGNTIARTTHHGTLTAERVDAPTTDFADQQLWPMDHSGSENCLHVEPEPMYSSTGPREVDTIPPSPPRSYSPRSESTTIHLDGSETLAIYPGHKQQVRVIEGKLESPESESSMLTGLIQIDIGKVPHHQNLQ